MMPGPMNIKHVQLVTHRTPYPSDKMLYTLNSNDKNSIYVKQNTFLFSLPPFHYAKISLQALIIKANKMHYFSNLF
jgi:hypothetical protein